MYLPYCPTILQRDCNPLGGYASRLSKYPCGTHLRALHVESYLYNWNEIKLGQRRRCFLTLYLLLQLYLQRDSKFKNETVLSKKCS